MPGMAVLPYRVFCVLRFAFYESVEEVCEALRIGENAAYALLGSGQLKGFRNGRRWRIPRGAARRFILKRAGLH